jgi:group I intron endonuclease
MNTGVYKIENTHNGNCYIGSTRNLSSRWYQHLRLLLRRKHHSCVLQSAWDKWGPGAFSFRPLLICDKGLLLYYEQRCIDEFSPEYNIASSAYAPTAGRKLSAKHRAKIGAALTGRVFSAETRLRMRNSHLGQIPTPEALAMLAATNRGKKLSPEHRAKISEAHLAYHARRS